jgi:phosphoribosylglycinamide formyltransferase-1
MFSIVILISGSGSNMQAIVRAAAAEEWFEGFGARITAVISNKADAKGLAWATEQGIPAEVVDHTAYASRALFDKALQASIDSHKPDLVVLAGFMRILGSDFVQHFEGRMINIHPSLLPAFTGLHTHQRAIDAGCRFAGATVHHVTPVLDEGKILAQAVVPVLNDDNEHTLAARVLTQEHLIYPAAIRTILQTTCTHNNS